MEGIGRMSVEYRIVDRWDREEIISLYMEGGWWKEGYGRDGIAPLIGGSFAFMVAVDSETGGAIGMGRAISDGVSDAYIQDVVVFRAWRGRGIGGEIIGRLLAHCLERGLVWVGLVAEPGTGDFYRRLGFKELKGEPMVYLGGDGDA